MTSRWEDLKRAVGVVVVVVACAAVIPANVQVIQLPPVFKLAYTQMICDCPLGAVCDGFCPLQLRLETYVVTPFGQSSGSFDRSPAWSPDAAQVAFVSSAGIVSATDIFVMDAQGGPAVNITSGAGGDDPAWSPDGRRIAFASGRDGTRELYLMDPDGSDVVRVTANVGFRARPAWSPTSDRLAFTCEVDPGNFDICAINTDGTGFVRLTDDPGDDFSPAWSPNGGPIAFATTRYGTPLQLAAMNVDGSGVSQVGGGIIGWDPAWSPDGSRLAFVANGGDGFDAIYVMRADGSEMTLFASLAVSPAWMPGPVIASFGVDCSGLVCNFDASSSLGIISGYSWDLGDGATATGSAVSHTYGAGGNYSVALTVTNATGASATERRTFHLTYPPVASFTVSCEALTCTFDWSSSYDPEGYGLSFGWDFGDGTTGWTSVSPRVGLHTYSAPGSYTATLRVSNANGATTTASQTITVDSFMHVGDIDAVTTTQQNAWSATATITVHDRGHRPVANAQVSARWSPGSVVSCTTNAAGSCAVLKSHIPPNATLTLTITSVTHGIFVYRPASNHDPDGDSDGTQIRISR